MSSPHPQKGDCRVNLLVKTRPSEYLGHVNSANLQNDDVEFDFLNPLIWMHLNMPIIDGRYPIAPVDGLGSLSHFFYQGFPTLVCILKQFESLGSHKAVDLFPLHFATFAGGCGPRRRPDICEARVLSTKSQEWVSRWTGNCNTTV